MPCHNSPLETLAAFFIAFASGVLTVLMLTQYIAEIRSEQQGRRPTPEPLKP